MMRQFKLLLVLLLTIILASCSKSDTSPLDVGDAVEGAKVVVVANSSSATTKAVFADEVILTLYIYQREDADIMNVKTTPYKVATATANGKSSTHTFLVDGKDALTVAQGATYDFVIVADAPDATTVTDGVLSSVVNGDVFYGDRKTVVVASDATDVEVTFGDNGDLAHLTTGVSVKATATEGFLAVAGGSDNTVNLSFTYADFGSYPVKSSLSFSSDPFALSTVGSKSSYTLKGDGTVTEITENNYYYDDVYASYDGYMLPYPLTGAATYNEVDIDFYIGVDGANVMLEAKAVQLPAFEANKRYTFTMEMDANESGDGKVSLYLSITDWDTSSWDSAMGGTDGSFMNVYVGGWDYVSWNSGMGGNDEDKLISSITGWSSASWTSNMGGTNTNGTNN